MKQQVEEVRQLRDLPTPYVTHFIKYLLSTNFINTSLCAHKMDLGQAGRNTI